MKRLYSEAQKTKTKRCELTPKKPNTILSAGKVRQIEQRNRSLKATIHHIHQTSGFVGFLPVPKPQKMVSWKEIRIEY